MNHSFQPNVILSLNFIDREFYRGFPAPLETLGIICFLLVICCNYKILKKPVLFTCGERFTASRTF